MAQPYWITESGSLGTITEQEFYNLSLEGRDPEEASNNTGLTFSLLAGSLPGGLALSGSGMIGGTPTQRSLLKGIPYEVSENVTSMFVIRIQNDDGQVADRTFSLTVAGPDSPEFLPFSEPLINVHDNTVVNTSIAAFDSDLDDLVYTITSGNLPPGLTMNASTGAITGRIGYVSESQDYGIVVEVTDGFYVESAKVNLRVHALIDIRADTTIDTFGNNITVDSTSDLWLADAYIFGRPFMTTSTLTPMVYRHDNYYIELISGSLAQAMANISFELKGALPDGILFDGAYEGISSVGDVTGTAMLYGTLEQEPLLNRDYKFSIRPKTSFTDTLRTPSKAVTIYGEWVEYTLSIRGDSKSEVIWS